MSILEVKGLRKVYTTRFGGNQVEALRNVSFSVEQGEYVAVMGESGSGKTTLLNILAALDKPTAGSVVLDGRELSKVGDADAAAFRRDNLGFVFQEFNLRYLLTGGQHSAAAGAGGQGLPGDQRKADARCPAAGDRRAAEKVSL